MINLIAAIGQSGQLGLDGKMPWHDSKDLKWFKSLTMHQRVVVGYRTAQTLPPLPGRHVIVMDRDQSPDQIIGMWGDRDLWIAGGAKTYELWMPYIDRFYISRVAYDGPADAWFPTWAMPRP